MQSDKVDGSFVTASGVSAGTDMALGIIATLHGLEQAQAIADHTEYQWHSDANSDPFIGFLNAIDIAALAG